VEVARDARLQEQLELIGALAARRLRTGTPLAELLQGLSPDPPMLTARRRPPGPERAPWLHPDTPLLGLGFLSWSEPGRALMKRIQSLVLKEAKALAVRVARPDVFNGWYLVQIMFGLEEVVDHDAFVVLSPDAKGPGEYVDIGWTGITMNDALTKCGGDLTEHREQYLRLFCSLVASERSRFPIVEAADAESPRSDAIPLDERRKSGMLAILGEQAPPELLGLWPNGNLRYSAAILYDGDLQQCLFHLGHRGTVEMIDDRTIWSQDGEGEHDQDAIA
jgi:hypothetical protein